MISNEIDENKTKYFVIAIILLIILSIVLVVHFNNKSLVSGEENVETTTKTTTTTTTTTTTKKVKEEKKENVNNVVNTEKVEVEVETLNKVEEDIYKTTIDEDNKLIYDYKLSNEITNNDTIKSTILNLDEDLISKNIIKLYDISLYDIDMNKKNVTNTKIDISIPITKDILDYEDYKVVYIDENNDITEEEFDNVVENGYIKFTTTHLSKYGIIGTKKKIDLTGVTVDIKINEEIIKEVTNIYASTEDEFDVVVNGVESAYKLYYLLKDEEGLNKYQEFKNNMLESVTTPSTYTLFIKVEVENNQKVFEIGKINIYDIVYNYDKNEEINEDVVIGEIKNEDGTEYNYFDKEVNKDIVIINKEIDETLENEEIKEEVVTDILESEEEKESEVEDKIEIDETKEENTLVSEEESIKEDNLDTDKETVTEDISNIENKKEDNSEINIENDNDEVIDEDNKSDIKNDDEIINEEEDLEDKATIKLNGNIYLVEETDISKLEITGYLIIDTSENITFGTNEYNQLLSSNIYTITIKSKEFSINGVKYTYEYVENDLVIKRIEDGVDAKEEINNLFEDLKIITDEENLILANPYK